MSKWNEQKVDKENINKGDEFNNGQVLLTSDLNAIVNTLLYLVNNGTGGGGSSEDIETIKADITALKAKVTNSKLNLRNETLVENADNNYYIGDRKLDNNSYFKMSKNVSVSEIKAFHRTGGLDKLLFQFVGNTLEIPKINVSDESVILASNEVKFFKKANGETIYKFTKDEVDLKNSVSIHANNFTIKLGYDYPFLVEGADGTDYLKVDYNGVVYINEKEITGHNLYRHHIKIYVDITNFKGFHYVDIYNNDITPITKQDITNLLSNKDEVLNAYGYTSEGTTRYFGTALGMFGSTQARLVCYFSNGGFREFPMNQLMFSDVVSKLV